MEILHYSDGVPSWTDHSSADPAAAAAFYGGLLGWDTPEGPPETGGYRVCTLRGHLVAGIGPQQSPGPARWTTYVNVADADAVCRRVEEHGGKVLFGPTEVMEQGRMAMIADPLGAVVGIWQANRHPGATLVNEPGTMCWNELITTDTEASAAFYGPVFGWQAHRNESEGQAYTEFQLEGRSIAGMMPKPEAIPAEVPPFWGVYFAVGDLEKTRARAGELGGEVTMGPVETPQGPFVVVTDPLGAAVSLIQLAEQPTS